MVGMAGNRFQVGFWNRQEAGQQWLAGAPKSQLG